MLTAIFGGTFNPFHIGHYEMLIALENDPNIEKILLMPDKLPPHKTAEFLLDDETRIEMCRIAAKDFKKCELCLIEFERLGKSYTYDTIKLLQKKYKDIDFAFVCGGDMLVYFDKWWRHEELMKMLPFIVFKRTDTEDSYFYECIDKFQKQGMRIILKEEKIPQVSSTQIRDNFSESFKLLPPEIYEYIIKSHEFRGFFFSSLP